MDSQLLELEGQQSEVVRALMVHNGILEHGPSRLEPLAPQVRQLQAEPQGLELLLSELWVSLRSKLQSLARTLA